MRASKAAIARGGKGGPENSRPAQLNLRPNLPPSCILPWSIGRQGAQGSTTHTPSLHSRATWLAVPHFRPRRAALGASGASCMYSSINGVPNRAVTCRRSPPLPAGCYGWPRRPGEPDCPSAYACSLPAPARASQRRLGLKLLRAARAGHGRRMWACPAKLAGASGWPAPRSPPRAAAARSTSTGTRWGSGCNTSARHAPPPPPAVATRRGRPPPRSRRSAHPPAQAWAPDTTPRPPQSPASAPLSPQTMFVATCDAEEGVWKEGSLQPYGPLPLFPSAQVLNYGQSVFEGMKAQRSATKDGRIVLFRPDCNADRMAVRAQPFLPRPDQGRAAQGSLGTWAVRLAGTHTHAGEERVEQARRLAFRVRTGRRGQGGVLPRPLGAGGRAPQAAAAKQAAAAAPAPAPAPQAGAARLSMVPPPEDLFLRAVTQTVQANEAWVPPAGRGSLYLRPLLIGSGPILGLGERPALPAPSAASAAVRRRASGNVRCPVTQPRRLLVPPPHPTTHTQARIPSSSSLFPRPSALLHIDCVLRGGWRVLQGRPAHPDRPHRGNALPPRRARRHGGHQVCR
jgi:hypothetical protein